MNKRLKQAPLYRIIPHGTRDISTPYHRTPRPREIIEHTIQHGTLLVNSIIEQVKKLTLEHTLSLYINEPSNDTRLTQGECYGKQC